MADDGLEGVDPQLLVGAEEESEDGDEVCIDDFHAAVERVNTTALGGALSEAEQARLYGLFMRVEQGLAPATPPTELHHDQWEAWESTNTLTREEAQSEYVSTARLAAKRSAASEVESEQQPLPPGLIEQLEASGFKASDQSVLGAVAGGATSELDVFSAARDGNLDALMRSLPADANAVDDQGLSPLHHAVDAEQAASVRALLEARADLACVDHQRLMPLHYAAMLANEEIVRLLVKAGAPLDVQDEDGATPVEMGLESGLSRSVFAAAETPES